MKKDGFTLIELLAVILILGIIALIAVPTVNSVLNEAKAGSFKATLNNLTKKIEETCSLELIKGSKITTFYRVNDGKISPEIELKGDIPNGDIFVNNKCEVTFELSNNSYVGIKKEDIEIKKCTNGCLEYSEPILNGAKPDIKEGLIPVNIEDNGVVKIADIYSKWYSYEEKSWANAILVTDATREKYKTAKAGEPVVQTDIIGYFVWIPRYKYLIPTSGTSTPSTIDIVFENKFTSVSNGNAKTEYLSHPAFVFDNNKLNGIWIGKFETTGTKENPTILPNAEILDEQNVKDQFETAISFNDFGLDDEAAMLKSVEWGSASYLSHSNYGINKQIRINNNESLITGCGSNIEDARLVKTCDIPYADNRSDYPQSTTGNITGIFDMSGGSWERMMGVYNNNIDGTGFTQLPDKKYYETFTTFDYMTSCNGKPCIGHAINETKDWYQDNYYTPSTNYYWICKGAYYNYDTSAGGFAVTSIDGISYKALSFRTVLR